MWRVTECNSVKNVKQNIIRYQWLQLIAQDYLENDSKSQTLRFIPDKSSKIRLAGVEGAYFSCQSPGSGSLDLNNLQSLHFYSCPLSNKVLTLEELNPLIKLVTITLLRNECSRNGGGAHFIAEKRKAQRSDNPLGSSASQNRLILIPLSHRSSYQYQMKPFP